MADPSSTVHVDHHSSTDASTTNDHPTTSTAATVAVTAASPLPPPPQPTPTSSSSHPVVQDPSSTSSQPPTPTPTFDPAPAFMEAYDCAKLNQNWNKVLSSLMIHPEWLTKIPQGRRWTMLHQIVFSGNVMHLNEVLALQLSNPQFRLLCKTLDNKTVREVATERAHIYPQMMRRIERLVAIDQLLNNAKERKWELVRQCISLQPDIVNEKPPYRRFYLAHHLAYAGELDVFKDLSQICHFKLDLLAENKTISQVAREHNNIPFAEYVESLVVAPDTTMDTSTGAGAAAATNTATTDDDSNEASSNALPTHYSPNFYDDISISFIPANLNLDTLFLPVNNTFSYSGGHHSTHSYHHHQPHHAHLDHGYATHSIYHGHQTAPAPAAPPVHDNHAHAQPEVHEDKTAQAKPKAPVMSESEQAAYEKTIMENIQQMSQQNLLNSITCCITKEILRDPVVAADGFTYERQAILSWFEHSNRSPMTNQELDNLELKPNYAIKSILQLLQGNAGTQDNADSKKTSK